MGLCLLLLLGRLILSLSVETKLIAEDTVSTKLQSEAFALIDFGRSVGVCDALVVPLPCLVEFDSVFGFVKPREEGTDDGLPLYTDVLLGVVWCESFCCNCSCLPSNVYGLNSPKRRGLSSCFL